jgi:F-type H+-transporting ATPase subunit gamma
LAGAGIKDIKRRIKSVESTKQITKAMELVASSKLRKAKEKAENSRPYFETLYDTVINISANTNGIKNEFLNQRDVKNRCYIVIAGDRGLAGGYNSNVLKSSVAHMEGKKEKVIAVGKKSVEFFSKRGYDLLETVSSVEYSGYGEASKIASAAMNAYKNGDVDEVYVYYTEFISPLVQEVKMLKLLPVTFAQNEKYEKRSVGVVEYEPSPEEVLNYIIPKYVAGSIYGSVLEAFASEQGARRIAMESATDNADDMIDKLELSYNRARQFAITQEISEIVGGSEALK